MANMTPSANNVRRQVQHTARQAAPWVERLARAGYAAKGIVYIVIGVLAVEAAWTGGGKLTNSRGALMTILQQPFGQFLLGLVGVGLAGYALWRFVEAGLDVENKGSDARGMLTRAGYVLSGIAYGVLAVTAFELVAGATRYNSGGHSTQDWTARLLAVPFGQVLVGLIGLVILVLGLAQMVKGYKADFSKKLSLNEVPQAYRNWVVMSGRWGYVACGIVCVIVGGFFVEAAFHADAQQAKGLGSALDLLAEQPYGPWVLGIVAVGLAAYGVFELVEARYLRIAISQPA